MFLYDDGSCLMPLSCLSLVLVIYQFWCYKVSVWWHFLSGAFLYNCRVCGVYFLTDDNCYVKHFRFNIISCVECFVSDGSLCVKCFLFYSSSCVCCFLFDISSCVDPFLSNGSFSIAPFLSNGRFVYFSLCLIAFLP